MAVAAPSWQAPPHGGLFDSGGDRAFRCDERICPKPLADLLSSMLGGDLTVLAREIAVCSARLTAKRTHMLVELRPHLASPLLPYLPTMALFLHEQRGERLDVRPQGALARKALGKRRAS